MAKGKKTNEWDQLPNETNLAFSVFKIYRDMGSERSITRVIDNVNETRTKHAHGGKVRKLTRQQCGKWSSSNGWVARCAAYDAHLDAIEQQKTVQHIDRTLEQWSQLRAEQREQELDIAQQLIEKAKRMLDSPLYVQKTERVDDAGNPTEIHIIPAGWKMTDVVRFVETANKLKRLALDMDTERIHMPSTTTDDEQSEQMRSLIENPETRAAMITIARATTASDDDEKTVH